MKKLLFALPVVLLLAAGCSSNQPVVENQPNNTQPTQKQTQTQNQPEQQQTNNQQWQTYTSPAFGYSINYPSNWSIDNQRGSKDEIVFNNGNIESHISISVQPYTKTVTDWKNGLDQKVITQTKNITIGGQSATEIYTGEMGGSAGIIGVVSNGRLYILNEADTMPSFMLESFKFTESAKTQNSVDTKDTDLTIAEKVVTEFMNDMKGSDYTAAYNKLSSNGQSFVNNEPQTYSQNDRLMYGLYGFISQPSLPDKGINVTSSTKINSSTVKVATLWKYNDRNLKVTFTLKLENGQWKIDKIQ